MNKKAFSKAFVEDIWHKLERAFMDIESDNKKVVSIVMSKYYLELLAKNPMTDPGVFGLGPSAWSVQYIGDGKFGIWGAHVEIGEPFQVCSQDAKIII